MPFDKFVNSNPIITTSWRCDNITVPFCPVDCGDIFQLIRTSWLHRQVPTLIAMLILIASFVHFILYFPPLILKCLLKSTHDSNDAKSEYPSVRLSTEILQQNASTPISKNSSNSKPEQQSNIPKRSNDKSRLLSNELENKALKISAAANALFKSTSLTYINATCVLDTPGKKTNSHESKNFNAELLNNSKVNDTERSLSISLMLAEMAKMSFESDKPVKTWHPEVKTNRREHMVHEIIRALLPKYRIQFYIKIDQNDDSINFGEELHPVEVLARGEEGRIYEMADSKSQYLNRIYSLVQQIHDNKFDTFT